MSSAPPDVEVGRRLRWWNPADWTALIGPGAIIASLTIGAGELVFSTRGGALFGYRLLWVFLWVLIFKWALVFMSARHLILTGVHPFQRWVELPGPRGWLVWVFGVFAVGCFPIWIAFHAGTTGTLLAWLTGTQTWGRGGGHLVWALGLLAVVFWVSWRGGYQRLETAQTFIVALMLVGVLLSLAGLRPDLVDVLWGLIAPARLEYPAWITAATFPQIAARPEWVEAATYVGVIGGSSYDYLAYAAYLRDKGWCLAPDPRSDSVEARGAGRVGGVTDAWPSQDRIDRAMRSLRVDSCFSFLAVLFFSTVFVLCGHLLLGPAHRVPDGADLVRLQAEFVHPAFPWLRPLYFAGAFLTLFGTLYGTVEVAPAIFREMVQAMRPGAPTLGPELRRRSIVWAAGGGVAVVVAMGAWHAGSGQPTPPGLIALLTPANLFTGVLGCGVVCGLNLWADARFLPERLRAPLALRCLNGAGCLLFLGVGLKAYADQGGALGLAILAGTAALGWAAAKALPAHRIGAPPPGSQRRESADAK